MSNRKSWFVSARCAFRRTRFVRSVHALPNRNGPATPASGSRRLADVPADIRRVRLQSPDTNYAEQRRELSLAWSLNTDQVEAHETTPIVNRGRMFITTPGNNVIAIDAKTGTQLWRYVKKYPDGLFQLHPTNRGVALYGDRVYMATTDCKLVALDAATGKEVWQVPIDDYKTGCYSTLAPLAARGKILVGYSGGDLASEVAERFDAETGKRIWRTYTIPAPDEPGGRPGPAMHTSGGRLHLDHGRVRSRVGTSPIGAQEIRRRGSLTIVLETTRL